MPIDETLTQLNEARNTAFAEWRATRDRLLQVWKEHGEHSLEYRLAKDAAKGAERVADNADLKLMRYRMAAK